MSYSLAKCYWLFDSSYNYIDCSIRVFSEDEYVAGVLETIRGGH